MLEKKFVDYIKKDICWFCCNLVLFSKYVVLLKHLDFFSHCNNKKNEYVNSLQMQMAKVNLSGYLGLLDVTEWQHQQTSVG